MAIAPSAAWEQISLRPDKPKLGTQSFGELYTLPVAFNVKAKKSFWHRFWRTYIWLIILGLALVLKDLVVPFTKEEDIKPVIIGSMIGVIIAIVGLVISQKSLVK
jgi:hypothetical protein